ncbi:hypothetical protein RSAG8_07440, partial [Rhizoctonia solani AG-8 WAC10335]
MAPKQSSKKAAKFYSEDIVRKIGDPARVAMVGRSWHDADDQAPPLNPSDPLELPLKRGEFGITDIEHRTRHIVPESEYELVDRTFRVGDVCKRGIDDVASAVVLHMRCELRLKHAISGVPVWHFAMYPRSPAQRTGHQLLTPEESANRPRPKQFWTAEDLHELTYVKIRAESVTRVPDRVTFKDPGAYQKYNVTKTQHKGESGRVLEVETMIVTESRSTIKIMWQDGTIEEVLGTSVIPYLNVDEYDCWPGDFVRWKNEDETRVAIIQSTNAQSRIAKVMWYGTNPPQTETVSVLELDPHGPAGTETFGVRRGDFVFLHRPGTTNGAQLPAVPRIGELEEWVREPPPMSQPHPSHTHSHSHAHTHSDENGHFHVYSDAQDQAAYELGREKRIVKVQGFKGGEIHWFGEVMNLTTGGLIQVVLPHGEMVEVPLERVTLLNNEGLDELAAWADNLSMDDGSSYGSDEVMEEVVYPDGQPPQEEEVDGWETEGSEGKDEDMESAGSWGDDEDREMPIPGGYIPAAPSPPQHAPAAATAAAKTETSPPPPPVPGPSTAMNVSGGSILDTLDEDNSPWHRFEVLPSAPADHAYYAQKTTSAQLPRSFMTRLTKEFKVLASSLPSSSLLQAFVSIQGLVLVKEPRLYSEKAYVLSRGFIRRALEIEVGGLGTEIEWYYIKQGRLAKSIADARALIAWSEAGEYEASKEVLKESDPAVGVLSEGAVIMLRRTLDKLDAILKERTKSS